MSAPTPRRWFQIHLSTAVVLMIVASVAIGANCRGKTSIVRDGRRSAVRVVYGFPCACYAAYVDTQTDVGIHVNPEGEMSVSPEWLAAVEIMPYPNCWLGGLINVSSLAAILFTVAFTCEFLIRRRQARAP